MREYMQIGLQYSIESLSVMDKKERQKKKMREMFTASQSKNQPLRDTEREREEEKTREGKKKKRRQQTEAMCLHISIAFGAWYTTIIDDQATIPDQFTCDIFGKSSKH